MYFKVFAVIFVAWGIETAFACNGFKAKLKRVVDCGGADQVVNIDEGFTIKLNKKCELIPTGCITTKGFKSAEVTFKVAKDGLVVKEGTSDVCQAMGEANEEAKNMIKIFALPDHCPVAEGKVCATEETKADISKYKNMLGMAKGDIQMNATIKHDNGISCFHMEMEVTK